jgi:hypothetical protein
MDTGIDDLFTGYSETLLKLKEFFAKKTPVKLKKSEVFLNYGDQSQNSPMRRSGRRLPSREASSPTLSMTGVATGSRRRC